MITVFSQILRAVLDYLLLDFNYFLVRHFLEARNIVQCYMDKIHVASDNKVFADVIYLMLIGCTVEYCKEILDQACALQLFGMFLKNIIRIFFYADLAKDPYQLLLAYGFKQIIDYLKP